MAKWRRAAQAALVLVVLAAGAPSVAAAPSDAPEILSPAPGASEPSNPLISWTRVAGATRYRVQVSASATFASFAYNVDTYNTKATPPADLPLGTLYFRIAALDAEGAAGPFAESNFEKVTSSAPVVTLPADLATLQYPQEPPLFVWEPVPGAKTYKLEIDDAADFIGATVYTTANTSYTLTDPQTVGQSFYWRVQGLSAANIATQWSPTRTYSVSWPAAPVLVAPADGTATATEDVVFEWEPVVGAHSYQLQVSPNGDWSNNVTSDVIVKSTRYSPPTTLQNNSYFWRVRARDGKSVPNLGPWSAERQFRRAWPDQPTLLTPAEASHPVTLPTFSWTPIDHASHYELQVSTDPNFSPGPPAVVDSCYTNHPSFTQYELQTGSATTPGSCGAALDIFEGMNPGTTYYWRVRGIDAPGGINGVFSDAQSFTYVPEIPVLSGPADGVTLSAPELDWAPVHGASKYEVTILKANGTAAQPAKKTYSTSHTPTTALTAADGAFRWYVRAMDTINGSTDRGGLVPNPASHRTFSLTTPATTSASPEPTAPADGAVSVDMPAMSWEPVTGAAKYQVVYGVAGSGIVQNLSPATLPYAGYTHDANLGPGDYFWYVNAFAADGTYLSTGSERTFTISNLDEATYVAPADCLPQEPCAAQKDTPTLEWEQVPWADFYLVHLSNDADFTNVVRTYKSNETSLTPRESLLDKAAGEAYYWFAQPCKTLSSCGRFNNSVFPNAYSFLKQSAAVEPAAPADAAVVPNQVSLSWNDYLATNQTAGSGATQEAKQYRVQVSNSADFATVLDENVVDQTTFTPFSETYPEGPLYWRVQAIDGSNNNLTYSPVRSLTKQSPALESLHPAHDAQVAGVPYFKWTPQAFAPKYEIEIYKNSDVNFSSANKVLTKQTNQSAWSPITSLAPGGYAWRVRRLDADNRPGPWSTGRVFSLQPGAAAPQSPDDGVIARFDDLRLAWSGVPEAASYKVEVSISPSFATLVESASTVMTSWAPTRKYTDGVYYWRVKPLDAAGNAGPASAARTFVIDLLAPETTISGGPSGTVTATAATFSATSEPGASFECSLDAAAFSDCPGGNATYEGLAQGPHTFKVRATDGAGNTDATPALRSFKVSSVRITKIVYRASTLNGEQVSVKNLAGTKVDLTGWKVADAAGNTYTFGSNSLSSGATLVLHSGKGGNNAGNRYWGRTTQVWGDTSDTAKLKRANNSKAHSCSYNNKAATTKTC